MVDLILSEKDRLRFFKHLERRAETWEMACAEVLALLEPGAETQAP